MRQIERTKSWWRPLHYFPTSHAAVIHLPTNNSAWLFVPSRRNAGVVNNINNCSVLFWCQSERQGASEQRNTTLKLKQLNGIHLPTPESCKNIFHWKRLIAALHSVFYRVFLSVCSSICPSVHLSIYPSIHATIHPTVPLSICPSVDTHPSNCPSVCLSVCWHPSIQLSIYIHPHYWHSILPLMYYFAL